MSAVLEQPRPRARSNFIQKLDHPASARTLPHASPLPARFLSLPTPSPSPSPSLSSSSSTSPHMLSLSRLQSLSLGPVQRHRLSPPAYAEIASDFNFDASSPAFHVQFEPEPESERDAERVPAYASTEPNSDLDAGTDGLSLYEMFSLTKSRVIRLFNLPSTSAATAHALTRLLLKHAHVHARLNSIGPTTSTPITTATTYASASPTSTSITSTGTTAFEMLSLTRSVKLLALNEEYGGRRPGEEDSIWAVFGSHEEACAALSLADSVSVSAAPALEVDLEPFRKLRRFELDTKNINALATALQTMPSGGPGRTGASALFPPSPTSPISTFEHSLASGAGQMYEFEMGLGMGMGMSSGGPPPAVYSSRGGAYQLSSNPPNPRATFRHGDWICASPACAAHNFGRNVICISCAAPRLQNGPHSSVCGSSAGLSPSSTATINVTAAAARIASPRFANMSAAAVHPHPHALSSLSAFGVSGPTAVATSTNFGTNANANMNMNMNNMNFNLSMQLQQLHQQQRMQPAAALAQMQMAAKLHPTQSPLLTPSGRALAVGGKVQNISADPLAPCIMFWPDNEPLPEPGQIRPPGLANAHQPPIMNTGNKGPIEQQPGDWVCRKCEYLNWRRRKVCQTCFPYAEGNSDSVSATMHAERLALLAAVYTQEHVTQAALQSQQQQQQQQQHQRQQQQQHMMQTQAHSVSAAYTFPGSSSVSASASASASNSNSFHSSSPSYPYSAARSSFSSAPARPNANTNVATSLGSNVNGRLAGQTYAAARRAEIASEVVTSGNIVYQTPSSPATPHSAHSLSGAGASASAFTSDERERYTSLQSHMSTSAGARTGPLLPSFLKNEVQPIRPMWGAGARTPASLSPASSSSADLSFDEYEEVGSPVSASASANGGATPGAIARPFYAHRAGSASGSGSGSGSGSSTGSGSTSSLTLGGSSIWSLDRDEDKAWNANAGTGTGVGMGALPDSFVNAFAGVRVRTASADALKAI
ncbi:hypothetical protein M0805_004634 [Coniferiporia weirii]|nr:hypothetical protein M0805_004634 [Coniferiporia weirii]